jgi:hypothetical protein
MSSPDRYYEKVGRPGNCPLRKDPYTSMDIVCPDELFESCPKPCAQAIENMRLLEFYYDEEDYSTTNAISNTGLVIEESY